MKNIFKAFLALMVVAVSFNSCEDSNNTIDEVFGFETGAILRTISVNNALLNSSDPSTEFSVTVEEQDEQDGNLLESVDVYVTIRDLTVGNGTTPPSESLVKTYPAADFTTGPVGLPRITATATFGEATTAMGLTSADYSPGDIYVMELRVNLTDGRTYGASSAAGIITGGFFSSPFKYNALITCSPAPGDYQVDMHDSFGDGWQTNAGNGGDGIHVDIDGVITVVGMCSPYGGDNIGSEMDPDEGVCTGPASTSFFDATTFVTVPVGAESATWNFPGDTYGEIFFEVYAPDGSLVYASGGPGEAAPGLLPITVCAE